MTAPVIDNVTVHDIGGLAGHQDDGWFVAVHAGQRTGWYGPVRRSVAAWARTVVAAGACGTALVDRDRLARRLSWAMRDRSCRDLSWAVGAVDCAIWDLRAASAGVRVADLLTAQPQSKRPAPRDRAPRGSAPGNRVARESVSAYASWLRLDLADPTSPERIAATAGQGWLFTKWGLRAAPGACPEQERDRLTGLALRASVAARSAVAIDAVATWTPRLTAAFGAAANPADLVWLEDPTAAADPWSCESLTASGIPLAVGERLLFGHDSEELVAARPCAFTFDVVGCGGITRALELIETARANRIPVFPHGRSLIPALHLAAAYPDVVRGVEYQLQWEPGRQRLRAEPTSPCRGVIALPDSAGLGATPRSP